MTIPANLERLTRIHLLINKKATGPPRQLAKKLSVSERQLYRDLEILKEIGLEYFYDSSISSYYYKEDFTLVIGIFKNLDKNKFVTAFPCQWGGVH